MGIEGTIYIVDNDDAVRDSLQALIDKSPGRLQLALRGGMLAIAIWIATNIALSHGYTPATLESEVLVFVGSLAIVLIAARFLSSETKRFRSVLPAIRPRAIGVGRLLGIWFAMGERFFFVLPGATV